MEGGKTTFKEDEKNTLSLVVILCQNGLCIPPEKGIYFKTVMCHGKV